MSTHEFKNFHLHENIEKGLSEAGFKIPSPIQKEAIPLVLQGHDIVAQAHTGTGKTAAFALPIMSRMKFNVGIEVLVITPTRELAMQISDEIYKLGKYAHVRLATVYGGQSYSRQMKQIENATILVATPGRLLDLLKSKKITMQPDFFVLDEADEMLNMGFIDDVKKILTYVPQQAQKLLFSATMPNAIKNIAEEFLHQPKHVTVVSKQSTNVDISQEYYIIEENERESAIIRLMDYYDPRKAIIFCRMKKETEILASSLLSKGYSAKALNGDMEQKDRESTMRNFKSGAIEILVATDIAARGLDIADTTHVVNYHLPFDTQSYVHRIGRTGRAGKKGMAITLITALEFKSLQRIKKSIGTSIEHKFIPSLQDVTDDLNKKLLQKIIQQPVNTQALELLAILEEELELSQIVHKLISILLETQKVSGPESIGLNPQHVKKIMEKFTALEKDGKSFSLRGGRRGEKNFRPSSRSGRTKNASVKNTSARKPSGRKRH